MVFFDVYSIDRTESIERDVSLKLLDTTENIGGVKNKYLRGLIKEVKYV